MGYRSALLTSGIVRVYWPAQYLPTYKVVLPNRRWRSGTWTNKASPQCIQHVRLHVRRRRTHDFQLRYKLAMAYLLESNEPVKRTNIKEVARWLKQRYATVTFVCFHRNREFIHIAIRLIASLLDSWSNILTCALWHSVTDYNSRVYLMSSLDLQAIYSFIHKSGGAGMRRKKSPTNVW